MEKKDIADIIYKKTLILLAAAGGSGAYAIKFLFEKEHSIGYAFAIVFIFMSIGIVINYRKLDTIEKEGDRYV